MVEKPNCPHRREEETNESLGSLSSIRHFERQRQNHKPLHNIIDVP